MILNSLKYSLFNIDFKRPFKNAKHSYNSRQGYIVALSNNKGFTGYGECSPLPGFSYEDLSECQTQINKLSQILPNIEVGVDINSIENFTNKRNLFPSVKFALEQCFVNLIAAEDKNFISKKLGVGNREIKVNTISSLGERLDVISGLEKKIKNGFETVKIKIGSINFDEDYKLVEGVRKYFGDAIKIRLDANCSWDKNSAPDRIKNLSSFNIEFIEEPCAHLQANLDISKKSNIPIALDESLSSASEILSVIKSSDIEFIVLKPTVITGFFSALRLIEEAEKKKKKIIISSAFESSLGKSGLVLLAAATKHNYAHGLDISDLFDKNTCADKYEILSGKISVDTSTYSPNFNFAVV